MDPFMDPFMTVYLHRKVSIFDFLVSKPYPNPEGGAEMVKPGKTMKKQ